MSGIMTDSNSQVQSGNLNDIVMVTFLVEGGYRRVSDAAFSCGMTITEFIARAVENAVTEVEKKKAVNS